MNGEQAGQDDVILCGLLDAAFRDAVAEANVSPGPSGTAVSVTLFTHMQPFTQTPEAAAKWLREHHIDGAARFDDDGFNLVVDLRTADAVHEFTDLLPAPDIRLRAAAADLAKELSPHNLSASVRADLASRRVCLTLDDNDDERTASALAGLLGAPGIDERLHLGRNKHLRRLAERLTWLLCGVTGSAIYADTIPGCAHRPDHIMLDLTLDQARKLIDRLNGAAGTGPCTEPVTA